MEAAQGERSPQAEHRFGKSSPLSIGVEEELALVGEDFELVPESERLIEAVGKEVSGSVSTEIFATQIELKTGICDDAEAARSELAGIRRLISEKGFAMLGAGLHPDDDEESPVFVDKPRYEEVQNDLASLLRSPPCGLHVHVGMPDPETAVRVANVLRQHLPMLQALTANSPFRMGVDSGLASARAAVVASYPRFEMPREFRDYEEFCTVADQLIAAAGVEDYTFLWWDVRPHPRLGTVEVRGMDVQTEVSDQRRRRGPDPGSRGQGDRQPLRPRPGPRGPRGVLLPGRPPRPPGAAAGRRRGRRAGDRGRPPRPRRSPPLRPRPRRGGRPREGRAHPPRGQRRRPPAPGPRRGRHGRPARGPGRADEVVDLIAGHSGPDR